MPSKYNNNNNNELMDESSSDYPSYESVLNTKNELHYYQPKIIGPGIGGHDSFIPLDQDEDKEFGWWARFKRRIRKGIALCVNIFVIIFVFLVNLLYFYPIKKFISSIQAFFKGEDRVVHGLNIFLALLCIGLALGCSFWLHPAFIVFVADFFTKILYVPAVFEIVGLVLGAAAFGIFVSNMIVAFASWLGHRNAHKDGMPYIDDRFEEIQQNGVMGSDIIDDHQAYQWALLYINEKIKKHQVIGIDNPFSRRASEYRALREGLNKGNGAAFGEHLRQKLKQKESRLQTRYKAICRAFSIASDPSGQQLNQALLKMSKYFDDLYDGYLQKNEKHQYLSYEDRFYRMSAIRKKNIQINLHACDAPLVMELIESEECFWFWWRLRDKQDFVTRHFKEQNRAFEPILARPVEFENANLDDVDILKIKGEYYPLIYSEGHGGVVIPSFMKKSQFQRSLWQRLICSVPVKFFAIIVKLIVKVLWSIYFVYPILETQNAIRNLNDGKSMLRSFFTLTMVVLCTVAALLAGLWFFPAAGAQLASLIYLPLSKLSMLSIQKTINVLGMVLFGACIGALFSEVVSNLILYFIRFFSRDRREIIGKFFSCFCVLGISVLLYFYVMSYTSILSALFCTWLQFKAPALGSLTFFILPLSILMCAFIAIVIGLTVSYFIKKWAYDLSLIMQNQRKKNTPMMKSPEEMEKNDLKNARDYILLTLRSCQDPYTLVGIESPGGPHEFFKYIRDAVEKGEQEIIGEYCRQYARWLQKDVVYLKTKLENNDPSYTVAKLTFVLCKMDRDYNIFMEQECKDDMEFNALMLNNRKFEDMCQKVLLKYKQNNPDKINSLYFDLWKAHKQCQRHSVMTMKEVTAHECRHSLLSNNGTETQIDNGSGVSSSPYRPRLSLTLDTGLPPAERVATVRGRQCCDFASFNQRKTYTELGGKDPFIIELNKSLEKRRRDSEVGAPVSDNPTALDMTDFETNPDADNMSDELGIAENNELHRSQLGRGTGTGQSKQLGRLGMFPAGRAEIGSGSSVPTRGDHNPAAGVNGVDDEPSEAEGDIDDSAPSSPRVGNLS